MVCLGGRQAEKAPQLTTGKKGPQQTGKRPPTDNMIKKSPHQTTGKRPPPDNMKRKTTNIQQAKRPRMEQKPTNLITGLEQ